MGLFSGWFGGSSSSSGASQGQRTAKNGTTFQPAKDNKHTIITRAGDSKPSVGHNSGKKK